MTIKNRKNAEQIHGKDVDVPSTSDNNKVMVYNADTGKYEYSNQFKDFHSLTQELSYTVDEERSFFKDDFSVDSSSQYTGDVGSFTWDTVNGKLTHTSEVTVRSLSFDNVGKRLELSLQIDTIPTGSNAGIWLFIDTPNVDTRQILFFGDGASTTYVKAWNATADTGSISNKWTVGVPFRFVVDLEEDYIQIGSYTRSFTFGVETINPRITALSSAPTFHIYEIAEVPSESYADDFSSDTTERYQAVTGTVAYDDTNKRMDVTTATGANGKASGRLKSYKFCEGSQIYDVLLPTGADGDFICLATHSANGLMTDGIGVGLQSDGAGNWNLATLSNTAVTEGADSGLDDADVARIEIEKDITGAYWYYIYDATGAKPTTATGKLFTTLTEGYTGWYANGNSKTYTIENISIRAESIVGRTNIEVTEPFWFRDDFGEDSRGRYVTAYGSIAGGKLTISHYSFYCTVPQIISGSASVETKVVDWVNTTWASINLFSQVKSGEVIRSGYKLEIFGTAVRLFKDNKIIQTVNNVTTGLTEVTLRLEFDSVTSTVTGYLNGATVITYVDEAPYMSGYACLDTYNLTNPIGFDYFEVSGTRVYQKPIHRGAQLNSYHDGTQEVVGTTFIDDCQWDRSAEYTTKGSVVVDTTNGKIVIPLVSGRITKSNSFGDGFYECVISLPSVDSRPMFAICAGDVSANIGTHNGKKYILYFDGGSKWRLYRNDGAGSAAYLSGDVTLVPVVNTKYRITLTKVGTGINLYIDGIFMKTWVDVNPLPEGNAEISSNSDEVICYSLTVIAAESSSTNGIAACIPPIGGGGRYDTQESITQTIDMSGIVSSDLKAYSSAISTNAAETAQLRITAKNDTDDTSVYSDGTTKYWDVTMDGTVINTRKALETNFNDKDDSIVLTHSTDSGVPDGCIYVRETICKPITIVTEEDLS